MAASNAENASVSPSSLSDRPTSDDGLGFQPYVDAVAAFLGHADTQPPLTLSIEGDWGSGKSSFMMQLKKRLKSWGAYTVWFNAWRHEKEDELWASFALQFTEQLAGEVPWYVRPFLHLKLAILRFNWRRGWWELIRVTTLTALIALISVSMYRAAKYPNSSLYNLWHSTKAEQSQFPRQSDSTDKTPDLKDLLPYLLKGGGWTALFLLMAAVLRKVIEIIGNPMHNDLTKFMQDPHFEGHSAFVEQFHADFSRMVKTYSRKNRIFVFVDDLDRCDVPKAADLMQALNLLISEDAPVFYILGLDREKIAAGLAAKYEKLLPFLSADVNEEENRAAIEFGFSYLEKFIQVPFLVPKIAGENLEKFLRSLNASQEVSTDLNSPSNRDLGLRIELSADSPEIQNIVAMVAPSLEYNPRRLKQFINLFRLRALLASQTGLFGPPSSPEKYDALTLEQLGKLVAIVIRWPLLLSDLESEPELLAELQLNTSRVDESHPTRAAFWKAKGALKQLIAFPAVASEPPPAEARFRLDRVDVQRFLEISPVVPGRGINDDTFLRTPWKIESSAPRGRRESADQLREKRATRGTTQETSRAPWPPTPWPRGESADEFQEERATRRRVPSESPSESSASKGPDYPRSVRK